MLVYNISELLQVWRLLSSEMTPYAVVDLEGPTAYIIRVDNSTLVLEIHL